MPALRVFAPLARLGWVIYIAHFGVVVVPSAAQKPSEGSILSFGRYLPLAAAVTAAATLSARLKSPVTTLFFSCFGRAQTPA
jgi:hypothetical protein